MATKKRRRLSKASRREQLLETARALAAAEGTDALTLGRLAERAGVSKPVVYEHFATRPGLLIALYRELDDRHVAGLRSALQHTPETLAGRAQIASNAFMKCWAADGGLAHSIAAALVGDEGSAALHEQLVDRYVQLYVDAFSGVSDLKGAELALGCHALVGAGESIASAMLRGRVTEPDAAQAFAKLIKAGLTSS